MQKLSKFFNFLRQQPRWRLVAGAVLVIGGSLMIWSGSQKTGGKSPTFAARRGPLEITVLEGGSLQALESQEIKCEVRVGYQGTKILKIVDEGYFVTEDDIKTNKVLVELDGSDLQKQIVQQDIQVQQALANLTDSEQNYEIQLGQNQTDISDAEQKARFARLDLDKMLGDTVTAQIITEVGLDKMLAEATTNNVEETSRAEEISAAHQNGPPSGPGGPMGIQMAPGAKLPAAVAQPAVLTTTGTNVALGSPPGVVGNGKVLSPAPANAPEPKPLGKAPTGPSSPVALMQKDPRTEAVSAALAKTSTNGTATARPAEHTSDTDVLKTVAVDFSKYANLDALGDGEAKQKLRKFDDDLQVAQKELEQAKAKLEGTRRLFDKGFVTKTEWQQDDIAFENSRLKVQTADTARDLYLRYDFLKSAEETLSKYAVAVHEFDKARRVAVSKLAQAKAKLKSAQGQYEVQARQIKDLKEQLEKCTLRAQKSGLVVYGGNRDDMVFYGGEERIREGATVRERQAIITIPDMTRMAVNVRIHESYIKKVKKGQKARITVDAFPDTVLSGEVTKVGVLPDSANRWMNPDLKVYLTTIAIDGNYDWVKPGMSAKVEILVNKVDNCVYVPVQAVSPDSGKQVCYVAGSMKPERREIQVGEFNDDFIEIKSGLKEGERVLLRAPGATEGGEQGKPAGEQKQPEKEHKGAPGPTSIPATASKA